jgi:hypothetical protein
MRTGRGWWKVAVGVVAGLVGGWLLFNPGTVARAGGSSDRFEDYVICTGPLSQNFSAQQQFGFEMDGVWLLDYRSGKLLGTALNRATGKLVGWAEVDLVSEFGIAPRANVHFIMTSGQVARGSSALYVAETTSGKIGVYTMFASETSTNMNSPIVIRRHDMTTFRGSAPRVPPDAKAPNEK